MRKLIFFVSLLILTLSKSGLFAQINVTTKLDINKSMGDQQAIALQSKIFNAALSGKIQVFKDDSFTRKISIDEIKELMNNDQVIQIFPDTNDPGMYFDSLIKKTLTAKDITGILACAIFYPDLRKRQYSVTYRSFALSMRVFKAGFDLGEQPVYWFGIDNLAGLLSPAEIDNFKTSVMKATSYFYNDQNTTSGNTQHEVNLYKYVPKNALTKINYRIYTEVIKGTLTSYEDKDFTNSLSPQAVEKKPGSITIINNLTDATHQETKADSTVIPVTPDSVCRYFVTENLSLNADKLTFTIQLLGLASGYNLVYNNTLNKKILYWTKFSDMAHVLGEPDCAGIVRIIYKATKDRLDVYYKE